MIVYPLVIHLGPITVTGYGIMMMVGFLVGGWAIQNELLRRGLNPEYAADIVVAAVIGGIVGAKLWYVALTRDPGALLSRGGLVWYGGFLGGVLAVTLNGWRKRVPLRLTMDLGAPALAVGYALGRVGCFLVQDDYGMPTRLPWGMRFPQGLPPTTAGNLRQLYGASIPESTPAWEVLPVHPSQLYEVAAMLFAFWVLWRLRRHRHGTGWLFGVYLLLAGAERFLVELVRAKDDRLLAPLTLAQAASLAAIAVGAVIVTRWSKPEEVVVPENSGVRVVEPAVASRERKPAR
ncbi:MAG: prolipoprotein diacylglyceryl transferase [Gemmatimonadetes bacterium]|nr:prolipoprotein diacylglyceryl transferase [Gemmatimonadota bacterium]